MTDDITDMDGNDVVTYIGEQPSLGELATTFYEREPNTFPDMGQDVNVLARSIIGTRKKKLGSVSGKSVKAGLSEDFTQSNMWRLLRGFTLSNYRAQFTTAPLDGAPITITTVAASDQSFNAAAGLLPFIKRLLVRSSGFTNAANNGIGVAYANAIATKLIVDGMALVDEVPPLGAKLEVIGVEFAVGDITCNPFGTTWKMTSTVFNFTTLTSVKGSWLFIGDDLNINSFTNAGEADTHDLDGYARIQSVAAHTVTFDKTTFTMLGIPADIATKKIRVYFPTLVLQDEVKALQVKRFYSIMRYLGADDDGMQSEVFSDCASNELTVNVQKKDKITVDFAYLPLDYQARTGDDGVLPGTTLIAPLGEDEYNTSSDVYRMCVTLLDPTTLNPTPLFGYATTSAIKLSNGITVNEAIGKVNGFSFALGEFSLANTFDAYFTTVAACKAVSSKQVATWDMIVSARNAGWYVDVPYAQLGGGMAKVEKNKSITMSLSVDSVECPDGYVGQWGYFPYLPDCGMSSDEIG